MNVWGLCGVVANCRGGSGLMGEACGFKTTNNITDHSCSPHAALMQLPCSPHAVPCITRTWRWQRRDDAVRGAVGILAQRHTIPVKHGQPVSCCQ